MKERSKQSEHVPRVVIAHSTDCWFNLSVDTKGTKVKILSHGRVMVYDSDSY